MPFVNPYDLAAVERLPGWFGRLFHSESMSFGYWEIAADAVPLHEHHHPRRRSEASSRGKHQGSSLSLPHRNSVWQRKT
jgi:hypothetical protein